MFIVYLLCATHPTKHLTYVLSRNLEHTHKRWVLLPRMFCREGNEVLEL